MIVIKLILERVMNIVKNITNTNECVESNADKSYTRKTTARHFKSLLV